MDAAVFATGDVAQVLDIADTVDPGEVAGWRYMIVSLRCWGQRAAGARAQGTTLPPGVSESPLCARFWFARNFSWRLTVGPAMPILKPMVNQPLPIDRIFQALADPTRRELISRLSEGPAAVSELAAPLPMSLAAVSQHLRVLEDCGLVATRKQGRVRTCELDARGLLLAEQWIAWRRALWEGRLDRLGELLESPSITQ